MGKSFEVVVGAPVEGLVQQARMLLGIYEDRQLTAVVLDSAGDEFVRVPNQHAGSMSGPLALSPDGRVVLLQAYRGEPRYTGLYMITLATGEQRWFEAEPSVNDRAAAMSPDGATIATLSTDADPDRPGDLAASVAAVDLVDVASGQRRRLWSAPGGWSAETVSWSPDGRLIAACYLTMDDTFATIVVDPKVGLVRHDDEFYLPHSPNGVWLGDRELVYFNADGELLASHLDHGDRLLLVPSADTGGHALGVLHDRIVRVAPATQEPTSTHFVTTDLHGGDRQTIVSVRPARGHFRFDFSRDPQLTRTWL